MTARDKKAALAVGWTVAWGFFWLAALPASAVLIEKNTSGAVFAALVGIWVGFAAIALIGFALCCAGVSLAFDDPPVRSGGHP